MTPDSIHVLIMLALASLGIDTVPPRTDLVSASRTMNIISYAQWDSMSVSQMLPLNIVDSIKSDLSLQYAIPLRRHVHGAGHVVRIDTLGWHDPWTVVEYPVLKMVPEIDTAWSDEVER